MSHHGCLGDRSLPRRQTEQLPAGRPHDRPVRVRGDDRRTQAKGNVDGNRDVAFVPVQVVNDPAVIAQNHAFVSINGALSVDLYGQVVADNIDGRQISGVGGHEDFVAGAEMRVDDHSLICLRSTAVSNGMTRSRIVAVLPEGSVVSTPRHHMGVVVTEYGSADLSGRTVRERAAALAEIAHPDFRDELRQRATVLGRH